MRPISMGEPRIRFDYLEQSGPGHNQSSERFKYAIIDEVDSILIDEARTPLIISMADRESSSSTRLYERPSDFKK